MVRLPSSKHKHYLTGIDWILHSFDHMNKRATGVGNAFQIVMELEGLPDEGEVRDWLGACLGKFPLLGGRARRDYNLCPYWEMPSHPRKAALAFDVHRLRADERCLPLLVKGINTPFGSRREHLAFQLIYGAGNSHAAVKFDHRLFDAHGAEMFLGMLQRDWDEGGTCTWEPPPCEPAHLSEWRDMFEAGRHLNRALLGLTRNGPPRALPFRPESTGPGFGFSGISFTERRSREIIDRAEAEAGYLMAMPYTMALTIQALHSVFVNRGVGSGDYIIPVTMDTRVPGRRSREVFFNHVSLLLFRIEPREVEDFSGLLKSIKQQMYEQTSSGLHRHLLDASLLMRIVPLPMVSYLLKLYLKRDVASFCFSFLGETGHMPGHFMGKRVSRSYHMARVPIPPGLGVFFHHSHGRLSAHLSCARGLMSQVEADTVLGALNSRLGG